MCRNVIAKVPAYARGEVKREYWAIFDGIEQEDCHDMPDAGSAAGDVSAAA